MQMNFGLAKNVKESSKKVKGSILFQLFSNAAEIFPHCLDMILIDEGDPDWLEPQMVRDTASFYWDSLSKRSVSSVVRLVFSSNDSP